MYAIVKSGGCHFKVEPGRIIQVDKLPAEVGEEVFLPNVLLFKDGDTLKAGAPFLCGATVTALVVAKGRSRKIIVFKKKRRQGYQKKQGHRQDYTTLKITAINV
ncbi:MAG: 50S ribosomal protein L21 [Candidatus Adiutrix intracellularis]|jgi:large subunit ribosomal protein L21|nr:50S ribosomal protein L21 [Candidatus Adiutrix intracellularis]